MKKSPFLVLGIIFLLPLISFGQTSSKKITLENDEVLISSHIYKENNLLIVTAIMSDNKKVGLSDFEYKKFTVRLLNDKSESVWKSDLPYAYEHSSPTKDGGLIYSNESDFGYFMADGIHKESIVIYQIDLLSGTVKELKYVPGKLVKTDKPKNTFDHIFGAICTKDKFLLFNKTLEGKCEFNGFEHKNPTSISSTVIPLPATREHESYYYGKKFNPFPIWELFDYSDGKAWFYSKADKLNYSVSELDIAANKITNSFSFVLDLQKGNYPGYESLQKTYPFYYNSYINGFPKFTRIADDCMTGENFVMDKQTGKILVSGFITSSKKFHNDNIVPTGYYVAVINKGTVEKTLVAPFKEFKKEFDARGGYTKAYINDKGEVMLHVHDWYNNGLFTEKDGKLVFTESKAVLHGPADAFFKSKTTSKAEEISKLIDTGNSDSNFKSIRKTLYFCVLPTTYLLSYKNSLTLIEYKKNLLTISQF